MDTNESSNTSSGTEDLAGESRRTGRARCLWWLAGAIGFALLYAAIQAFSFQGILKAGPDTYWDTDPYERMYRVGSILDGHSWIIRFQNVDGYPEGHASHWTLPLDAWIVALAKLTSRATAGLLASPLIGLLCVWCFTFWCFVRLPRPIAWAASILYLAQPAFHWATALGRPDHQCITHLCFLVAVIMDLGFWMKEFESPRDRLNRWRIVVNALAIGVSLWTTIETLPLLVVQVASTCVIAVVLRRQGGWQALGRRALGWLLVLVIAMVAFGIECQFDPDQIRIGNFREDILRRWFSVVQEFEPLMRTRGQWRFNGLHGLFGLSFYLSPLLLWFFLRSRALNKACKIAFLTALVTYGVMVFSQIHWTSNMAVLWPLFAAVAIASAVDGWRTRTARKTEAATPGGEVRRPGRGVAARVGFGAAIALLFFPCPLGFIDFSKRDEFGTHLRPVCDWIRANTPPNRDTATFSMITPIDKAYSIMTQWWQGTYILYGARRPVVATPYHTNIDAILDSYRFFVASSWAEAEPILREHRCRYVLTEDRRLFVDDAQRVLQDGRTWVEFHQRKMPNGRMGRAYKFTSLFYETMFYRLQVLNGGGLPFRLVYESRERSEYDPAQARFKVFEYVNND